MSPKAALPVASAKLSRLRVRPDLLEGGGRKLLAERDALGFRGRDLLEHGLALRVAEKAAGVARDERTGRIDDPIADRPHDRGVEEVQPPARQRIVELLDAVPFVAGRLAAGDRVEVGVSRNRPSAQSSASGMRAASANRERFFGQRA